MTASHGDCKFVEALAVLSPGTARAAASVQPVKIGLVSDIHTDASGLEAVISELSGEVDELWCAGDIVLEYRFCARTIALLRDVGATAIQGNHDIMLLSPAGAGARRSVLDDDPALAWLGSRPRRHEETINGCRLLMVHGNPWPPFGDYLPPHDRRWRDADRLGVDVLLTGHTHLPMVERFGRTLVINPGSVGEPRTAGDRRSTYAVVDVDGDSAEIRWLPVVH